MSGLYGNLTRTLEDLAAPADEQEAALRKAGVGPDELALDFNVAEWTETALYQSLNWAKARKLASKALALMHR